LHALCAACSHPWNPREGRAFLCAREHCRSAQHIVTVAVASLMFTDSYPGLA
jgi:hypothetical protein